jgi:hypothetical protein
MEQTLGDKVIDIATGLKTWVELQEWFGLEETVAQLGIDMLTNPWVTDVDKALNIVGVVANDVVAKVEYVHTGILGLSVWSVGGAAIRKTVLQTLHPEREAFRAAELLLLESLVCRLVGVGRAVVGHDDPGGMMDRSFGWMSRRG